MNKYNNNKLEVNPHIAEPLKFETADQSLQEVYALIPDLMLLFLKLYGRGDATQLVIPMLYGRIPTLGAGKYNAMPSKLKINRFLVSELLKLSMTKL